MQDKIQQLSKAMEVSFAEAATKEQVDEVLKSFIGKKGALQEILKGIKDLPDDQKKAVGPLAYEVKEKAVTLSAARKEALAQAALQKELEESVFDPTMPGRATIDFGDQGGLSPFTRNQEKAVRIFEKLGFTTWEGDDIVTDFENFSALNFPEDHPAREMHDTFYVDDEYLLRTHTSALQNTILKQKNFPIRAIVPGKCFRNETTDARHEAIFTQLEGVVVDENITIAHLMGTLDLFVKELFDEDVKTRIRPGYFPFVEPCMELEIDCLVCKGKGCKLCKGLGWIEVMPCGMIHPTVLRTAGIDPDKYSGFAFGFGMSRLTQLKYGIADCRMMYADDPRFLKQFS